MHDSIPKILSRCQQTATILFVAGWIALMSATQVSAIGKEDNKRHDDLNFTIDTRWAGCAHGGYYPIRIEVANLGKDRNLTFKFEPYNSGLPTVTKSIVLKTNAKTNFSLSIPMTGRQSNGTLDVYINGKLAKPLRTTINLADTDTDTFDRPALLVISSNAVDFDQYEDSVNWLASRSTSAGGYHGHSGSTRTEDYQIVEPNLLPERWIDYSGLDLVAISMSDLGRISSDARQALLDWVKTGGNLIVSNVGELPQQSQKLNDLCQINKSSTASSRSWNASSQEPTQIPLVEPDAYSGHTVTSSTSIEPSVWDKTKTPFQVYELMNGTVTAFQNDPFPGSRHEWAWLLNTLGPDRIRWTYRNGLTSRLGHDEFLHFMIPGISGVPVIAFLILITIFSVVIGPLNYFYLSRHKKLYLLILTIPAIALVTSVSLFSYSFIAHGFSTKSRIRSLMTVDQQAAESVTTTRVSLYSGLAPSGGLQFQADTAVYPIWPNQPNAGFASGTVNWTNQQSLQAGWLKSRTRTQFYTVAVSDQRGRLTISPPSNSTLEVANGFEYDLEQLVVRGSDGKLYYGENIRADSKKTLQEATTQQTGQISSLLRENQPALPANVDTSSSYNRSYSYRGPYDNFHSQFSRNMTERKISQISSEIDATVGDRQYFGLFAENPEVPIGITGTSERNSLFLLHGYY
jgi:hypothetical protein